MTDRGPWRDPEAVAALRRMVERGLSGGEIAAEFGEMGVRVSRNAVMGRCHRMGLSLCGAPAPNGEPVTERVKKARKSKAPQVAAVVPAVALSVPAHVQAAPERRVAVLPAAGGLTAALLRLEASARPAVPVMGASALFPPTPVPLMQATTHCRYPAFGAGAGLLVCGAPLHQTGRSYCAHHHALTHSAPSRPVHIARDMHTRGAPPEELVRDLVEEMGDAA